MTAAPIGFGDAARQEPASRNPATASDARAQAESPAGRDRWGATPEEVLHFARVFGLADLRTVVSNPNAKPSGRSTLTSWGKVPSQYNRQARVVGITGWPLVKKAPSDISAWEQNPDYGICLVTRRVRALDIDIENQALADEVNAVIDSHLDKAPMRYRSKSAKSLRIFVLEGEFSKRVIKTQHSGMIEFLGDGQQFIACGTHHPTLARYAWRDRLPEVVPTATPEQFEALWADLRQFGVATEVKASSKKAVLQNAVDADPIARYLRDNGWVLSGRPDGGLHIRCPFEDEHTTAGSISSTVYWPRFTGGHEKGTWHCLHAHCAGRTQRDFRYAIGFIGEDADFAPLEVAPAFNPVLPVGGGDPDGHIVFPAPFPGVMADAVAAALNVATKPQPEISTMSALIGMAGAIPGGYHLPSGMRLNLFGCNIAGTGEGKDMPRRIATDLVRTAGGETIGRPASGEGMEDALEDRRGMLVEVDEIAHLFAAVNGSRVPAYLVSLASTWLRLFSSGAGDYQTRRRAKTTSVSLPRTIANPTVSILGSSTPQKLGEALGTSNIEDGLLGRFLFAWGRDGIAPRRHGSSFSFPDTARCKCDELRARGMFGNENSLVKITIPAEVDAYLAEMLGRFEERRHGAVSPFARALFARSAEKAERVAGVLAVWDACHKPVMSLAHVEWAERFLTASDSALIKFTGDYMHGGQVQADAKLVLRTLGRILGKDIAPQKASEKTFIDRGMAPWSMVLRASKLDKKRMDEAVAHLCDLGDVVVAGGETRHVNGSDRKVRLLYIEGK